MPPERRKNPPASYLSTIGQHGGQVRSASKKQSGKDNCAKAREAKALYRRQPELRPHGKR